VRAASVAQGGTQQAITQLQTLARPRPADSTRPVGTAAKIVGLLAVVASVLYFVTDVIEASQGGFL
jgi:hypothetical protein